MVILHSNLRGYNSKKESLLGVVKDIDPDICILNETGLKGRNKVNIPGYITFSRNREVKSMGGISTSIKEKFKNFAANVGQGVGDDEFIITRHSQLCVPINVINWYGEQESRSCNDEVESRWNRIVNELEVIE